MLRQPSFANEPRGTLPPPLLPLLLPRHILSSLSSISSLRPLYICARVLLAQILTSKAILTQSKHLFALLHLQHRTPRHAILLSRLSLIPTSTHPRRRSSGMRIFSASTSMSPVYPEAVRVVLLCDASSDVTTTVFPFSAAIFDWMPTRARRYDMQKAHQ